MKYIYLILLMLLPTFSAGQIIKLPVAGSDYGRRNKSFSLNDLRDFPDYSDYAHTDGFYFDTVFTSALGRADLYSNLKGWLATNFQSLPDVLKLDDSSHLVIHSRTQSGTFSLDFRLKDGKGKILLYNYQSLPNGIVTERPIYQIHEAYSTNAYRGGKKPRWYAKKRDLILLADFDTLAKWLQTGCIPAMKKESDF